MSQTFNCKVITDPELSDIDLKDIGSDDRAVNAIDLSPIVLLKRLNTKYWFRRRHKKDYFPTKGYRKCNYRRRMGTVCSDCRQTAVEVINIELKDNYHSIVSLNVNQRPIGGQQQRVFIHLYETAVDPKTNEEVVKKIGYKLMYT